MTSVVRGVLVMWYNLTFRICLEEESKTLYWLYYWFIPVYFLFQVNLLGHKRILYQWLVPFHFLLLLSHCLFTEGKSGNLSGDRMILTTNVRLWILEILGTTSLPIPILTALMKFILIDQQKIITRLVIFRTVTDTAITEVAIDPKIQTSRARKLSMVSNEINCQPCLRDLLVFFW